MDSSESSRKHLFEAFPPVPTEAWEEKIMEDLKGADYEKKLVWKTAEGLSLRPYYRQEDLAALGHLDHMPGQFPYIRGKGTESNDWRVRQDIRVTEVKSANDKALDILMKGIDSLGFILDDNQQVDHAYLDNLLKNIYAHSVELNFSCGQKSMEVVRIILELVKAYNRDLEKIHGSVDFDPLSTLVLHGKWEEDEASAFRHAAELIEAAGHLPHFRVVGVHASVFHNAGADTVQELAYALAAGNEYLARITSLGMSVTRVAPRIGFSFAAGSNFFVEIAKYRAARMLWAKIVKAYGGDDASARMYIHVTTSLWNKTLYDPYVNMLRTTTEAMSAVLAGIDSLSVGAYDLPAGEAGEFGERIARNQQLLLKEESYLDKVVDPSAGSYFIEKLTDELAAAAWALFQKTEAEGGYLKGLYAGTIQDAIAGSARQRDMEIAQRKLTLLGVNQYPNPQESLASYPVDEESGIQGTEIRPLKVYRGAAAFERLRYAVDRHVSAGGARPAVFLLTYGNLAFRKARAGFATNFFGCAGFRIMDNPGFADIEQGIEAARASGAAFVVICSSDEEYADKAPVIQQKLGAHATVILAGYPKDLVTSLQAAGLTEFIHVRSNVLESLQHYVRLAGINA